MRVDESLVRGSRLEDMPESDSARPFGVLGGCEAETWHCPPATNKHLPRYSVLSLTSTPLYFPIEDFRFR